MLSLLLVLRSFSSAAGDTALAPAVAPLPEAPAWLASAAEDTAPAEADLDGSGVGSRPLAGAETTAVWPPLPTIGEASARVSHEVVESHEPLPLRTGTRSEAHAVST